MNHYLEEKRRLSPFDPCNSLLRSFAVSATQRMPNSATHNLETQQLIDLHGGRSDLRGGRLRAVGVADERLQEDALRVLRVYRFAASPPPHHATWTIDVDATATATLSILSLYDPDPLYGPNQPPLYHLVTLTRAADPTDGMSWHDVRRRSHTRAPTPLASDDPPARC